MNKDYWIELIDFEIAIVLAEDSCFPLQFQQTLGVRVPSNFHITRDICTEEIIQNYNKKYKFL